MMRDLSRKTPWVLAGIGATALFAAAMAFVGLVLLPSAQPDLKLAGLWDAICGAAGVTRAKVEASPVKPTFQTSAVVLSAAVASTPAAIGHGATLAHRCAICHGATQANDIPNLAGQASVVIRKELEDFRSGARVNAVMGPFATALSPQDVSDVAAYYSDLARVPGDGTLEEIAAPRIVLNGAPMRNIPPCGSCHGALASKAGAPWLDGQSAVYLSTQLAAFKHGQRHNDINEQMRNVARQMTSDEIISASNYFAHRR
jgi:cytochrome c553